jgi:hypothetical protein
VRTVTQLKETGECLICSTHHDDMKLNVLVPNSIV